MPMGATSSHLCTRVRRSPRVCSHARHASATPSLATLANPGRGLVSMQSVALTMGGGRAEGSYGAYTLCIYTRGWRCSRLQS